MVYELISFCIRLLVVLFILMLILIKPNRKRDVSYFKTKMYAHRGLHGNGVPENSLAAFRLAYEKGYGVELDVQMTKDGRLVVFHDGSLKRVCNADGYLRDYTYEELQKFSLCGTDEKIPLFSEVLKTIKDTDLICEIKSDNGQKNYSLCEKVYAELSGYEGRYCIESFSPFLVRWFKKYHPEVIRGQLSCNMMQEETLNFFTRVIMTHLLVNVISKPDFIAYKHQDMNGFGVRLCKGIYHPFFIAWTAKGDMEQKKAWGSFDSVIFEQFPEERE